MLILWKCYFKFLSEITYELPGWHEITPHLNRKNKENISLKSFTIFEYFHVLGNIFLLILTALFIFKFCGWKCNRTLWRQQFYVFLIFFFFDSTCRDSLYCLRIFITQVLSPPSHIKILYNRDLKPLSLNFSYLHWFD